LKTEKHLAGTTERKVTGPEAEERGGGCDADEEKQGEGEAGGAEGVERGGAGADEPAERGELGVGGVRAELAEDGVKERLSRENALGANEAGELRPRRGEGEGVDDGKDAEEE
jgi:hypothetical protein